MTDKKTVRKCAEVLARLFETYPCNYGYCMKRILCDNCPDDKTPADCWEYLLKTRIEEQGE